MQELRENPVRQARQVLSIPALACDTCGEIKGSSRHLRRVVGSFPEIDLLNGKILPGREWRGVAVLLAQRLGVNVDDLEPGMDVGPPCGEICAEVVNDIVHPFPGQLWVKPRVIEELRRLGATGVEYHPVELIRVTAWDDFTDADAADSPKGPLARSTDEPCELWELSVTGRAWRKGVSIGDITECSACGRTRFPMRGYYAVDETRWDGSDFFNLDQNPNIVMVTERVCELFRNRGFTNWSCVPAA